MTDTTSQVKEFSPWYTINKRFLPTKFLYFCTFAGIGSLLPFIPLFMKQQGLTELETAIVYGIMPFIGFIFRPIFGLISDRTQKPKTMLSFCCIFSALFYVLLLVVPGKPHSETAKIKTRVVCTEFDSYINDCHTVNITKPYCPMSFQDFLSSSATYRNITPTSIVLFSINSTSFKSEYDVINESDKESGQTVKCKFTCIQDDSTVTSACFTNNALDLSNRNCDENDFEEKNGINFSIMNILNISHQEVKIDRQNLGYNECKDYDLKHLTKNNATYFQMLCKQETTFSCELHCSNEKQALCAEKMTSKNSETFWLFFVIFLLANIVFAPIVSLGDAMVYDILGDENRNRWGKQRLWGTIGFALLALCSTILMDYQSIMVSFFLSGFFFVATSIIACFMPVSEEVYCGSMGKHVRRLFSHCQVTIFLCVVLLFGFYTGGIEAFLFWFLEKELGNTVHIIPGLCIVVNCVTETCILFFAGRFIKRTSHLVCLYITFIAYAIRFISYSFLVNPWTVLPIEVTHGVTYGLFWAAASSYASIITPPGLSATIQGILTSFHFGLGKGVGSLVTGWLYKPLGIRWVFRLYSAIAVIMLVLYFIINKTVFKTSRKPYEESDTPATKEEMKELASSQKNSEQEETID